MIIKVMWTITSVSVMVIMLALAIAFSVASGSILAEDVAIRHKMSEQVEQKREYAQKHCTPMGSIDDPKHTGSIQRQLYRCPAYEMLVI